MNSTAFWKAVVQDRSDFLEGMIDLLATSGAGWCVVGGVAVNAYVEPVVTQDLDIVVATEDLGRVVTAAALRFRIARFVHSINVYDPDSRLQVQLEAALAGVVACATRQEVLGLVLPVATPEDIVAAKVAAATDPRRRPSKRMKDVLDLARLASAFPALLELVPEPLRTQVATGMDPA